MIVFVVFHAVGIRKKGLGRVLQEPGPRPAARRGVLAIVFLLELLTYFITRPAHARAALFGNMFAGHLLLLLFITGGEYLCSSRATSGWPRRRPARS